VNRCLIIASVVLFCGEMLSVAGVIPAAPNQTNASSAANPPEKSEAAHRNPLLDFKFTNERGQPVSLGDFHGQALGITFIFTRCPLPNFCPRLSKNFQEASEKLSSIKYAPTNWHFLSVTFDPEHDTPEVLKRYADSYHYDPAHWTFVTGPAKEIGDLARESGIEVSPDGSTLNHNFRTLIIDASGKLQNVFPTSGDLSDAIVAEMLKACSASNTGKISGSTANSQSSGKQ
jgi:protein SCO1/2